MFNKFSNCSKITCGKGVIYIYHTQKVRWNRQRGFKIKVPLPNNLS